MRVPAKYLGALKNLFKRVRAFKIELDFGSVGFKERGKAEYLEKNLLEQGREPTANLTHIWRRRRDLNPEARDLTTAQPLLVSYLFPFYMGTQRDDSSKPLKHSIVKRILVFKR